MLKTKNKPLESQAHTSKAVHCREGGVSHSHSHAQGAAPPFIHFFSSSRSDPETTRSLATGHLPFHFLLAKLISPHAVRLFWVSLRNATQRNWTGRNTTPLLTNTTAMPLFVNQRALLHKKHALLPHSTNNESIDPDCYLGIHSCSIAQDQLCPLLEVNYLDPGEHRPCLRPSRFSHSLYVSYIRLDSVDWIYT